ncbi:hypothetical protein CWO90_13350 [Bradyrhizobium sp. Leo121]|nr:hypothetical protein CWO90_13350 [Bradyrhizobium sp. Leo121]
MTDGFAEAPPHPKFKLRLNFDLSPQAGRGEEKAREPKQARSFARYGPWRGGSLCRKRSRHWALRWVRWR